GATRSSNASNATPRASISSSPTCKLRGRQQVVGRPREGANPMKKATFGAGCFWGVEATFRRIPGVIDAAVGYSGGHTEDPTKRDVCTDQTGHAEVVQVDYDPARVSYEQLLEVFFMSHDPTQLNRQGPDIGTQYRSVILYHDEEQKAEAEEFKARFESLGRYRRPIVTQIVPAASFYRAEEYHQQYLKKRGLDSCSTHM